MKILKNNKILSGKNLMKKITENGYILKIIIKFYYNINIILILYNL